MNEQSIAVAARTPRRTFPTSDCSTICCSASAAPLLEVARDPKHLGADIGLLSVLHNWGHNLQHHPDVHWLVPAGGLVAGAGKYQLLQPPGSFDLLLKKEFVIHESIALSLIAEAFNLFNETNIVARVT